MMKIKTKNLPLSAIREAMQYAGGLYRMNAKGAYGFNVNDKGELNRGMFLDTDEEALQFLGVIFLKDKAICGKTFKVKTLWDVESGETRLLKQRTKTSEIAL